MLKTIRMLRNRWALALLLVAFAPTRGSADPNPIFMAVLGDSISAATLSDVPIPADGDPEERVRRWANQGIHPEIIIENKLRYSWASGRRIRSQYVLLKEYLKKSGEKRRLEVLNVSVPGARTEDLPEQARQTVEAALSGKYSELAYITLLIGSNDACAGTPGGVPLEKMRESLLRTFEILSRIPRIPGSAQARPIPILLVGIPRIPDLGEEKVRHSKTLFGLSCETVRNKILNLCDPLLLWENWDEYDRNMLVIEDRNRLLRTIVHEANRIYPRLDVFYTNRLYNLEIPRDILAADCFHPNKDAQEIISLQVWEDQPWFKERKTSR